MAEDKGRELQVDVREEMKQAYLSYAMSVIVGRALPDVRDGLKPVHRRILFAMKEMGLSANQPYRKSARVVGDVLGKYHPHGDMAVYDALVRMAQDFTYRYPLVDGHGNFGSIDGDPPAAMRYTEVRLAPIAQEMLSDLDKETVDFIPNFDESLTEPAVLPAPFPQLLANGASGIAVGMATNIPPHNLGELIDAALYLIDHPQASVDELMTIIPGPDFPTYGRIMGREGIRNYFRSGRGKLVVRGRAEIEEIGKGRQAIIIRELPYQINKASLVEAIARLIQVKKLNDVSEIRDESDREGIRIVLELKREANPDFVLNYLYKHTALETSFGVILLALVEGKPETMSLKAALNYFLGHRREVVTRRSRFELNRAEERSHILEGFLKALDQIDLVIAVIRSSERVEEAKERLMSQFDFTPAQAQAILDMRLQRLVALEREKIQLEYQDLQKRIGELKDILEKEPVLWQVIREELQVIKEKYGDQRRTQIVDKKESIADIDLIPEEDIVITLTRDGYVKRLPLLTYRRQGRGGVGISGTTTKEEDFVSQISVATTLHRILFFTSKGRAFQILAHQLPQMSRQSKGTHLINLFPLENGETMLAFIPLRDFSEGKYLFMVTARGKVKKTDLLEFISINRRGIRAINLEEGDTLSSVFVTGGQNEIFLATAGGRGISFSEKEVRPMGRVSRGVKGINLRPGDQVVGACPLDGGEDLLVVSTLGLGKKLALDQFPRHHRGGRGIIIMKITSRTGKLARIIPLKEEQELLVSTQEGMVIRLHTREIPRQGRAARGVRLVQLRSGDSISSLTLVCEP